MDVLLVLIGAAIGWCLCWHFFPRVKEVEHIIFKDILDEVKYLEDAAKEVVQKVEKDFANAGGEAKAHQALALLMKLYPSAPKWDIRVAIELAVKKCLG